MGSEKVIPETFYNAQTYNTVHKWINYNFGKPDTCENCGRTGLAGRLIHWANVSKSYLRERKDWKRLCVKCHKRFDFPPSLSCKWGHEFTKENTYIYPAGKRDCRTCRRKRQKEQK